MFYQNLIIYLFKKWIINNINMALIAIMSTVMVKGSKTVKGVNTNMVNNNISSTSMDNSMEISTGTVMMEKVVDINMDLNATMAIINQDSLNCWNLITEYLFAMKFWMEIVYWDIAQYYLVLWWCIKCINRWKTWLVNFLWWGFITCNKCYKIFHHGYSFWVVKNIFKTK